MNARWLLLLCVFGTVAQSATAELTLPISPAAAGSDGVLNVVSANLEIDLSLAVTGTWDMASPELGKGVYDPEQWMVVFKYSSVNVASGRTVTFKNHPSRAPVVWLVSGDTGIDPNAGNVVIAGHVNLNGKNGSTSLVNAEPGPGGWRGGRRSTWAPGGVHGSAGHGPGGGGYTTASGNVHGAGGSYGTAGSALTDALRGKRYGNASIIPLIGGSAGAGGIHYSSNSTVGGGGGGGAILIAASSLISQNGTVSANGGNGSGDSSWTYGGGGSGGAIRLVSDTIHGGGALRANQGTSNANWGGFGRIRVEANDASGLVDPGVPPIVFGFPGDPVVVIPPPESPKLTIIDIAGQPTPADPLAALEFPVADVSLANPFPVTVQIEARNMPLDWVVTLRLIPKLGADSRLPATYVSGDETLSFWEADVQFFHGFSALQVHAVAPNP